VTDIPTPTYEVLQHLSDERFTLLKRYAEILATKGIEWGLLGPHEAERIWERHLLNSLALASLISQGATVVDVGSGAGLPGIPLAINCPALQVVLLEPLLRRHTFLVETVEDLGLASQIEVVRGRAEDHHKQYQYVVCRAVAPLTKLLQWCLPLLTAGGELLALKGKTVNQELTKVLPQLRRANLAADIVTLPGNTFVVRVH
jgi:16S rRNA (guanine527-N7)-methyltransferase